MRTGNCMDALLSMLYCIFTLSFLFQQSVANDTITISQLLVDGETLVSNGGSFELGFFSPTNSQDRYLGIWYKKIPVQTVVWVANRLEPIEGLSGSLTVNITGSLVLLNGTSSVVWSAVPVTIAQNPVMQLLDSGNLVIRDNVDDNTDMYLWQSFDYPSDTLLPGMKLGWDFRASLNRRLSSWRSPSDPSPGELTIGIELDAYPQKVMCKGAEKFFRGGPWNGLRFNGAPELKINPLYDYDFVSNENEVYYTYKLHNESVITRLVVNDSTSSHQRYVWVEAYQSWSLYSSGPHDYCDNYGLCGANGICIISESPVCQCLKGFSPRLAQSWNSMNWSHGCVPDEPLNCTAKYDFVKFTGLKVPDTKNAWVNTSMNLRECKEACLKNCSCMAYTNLDISGEGNLCTHWFGDLFDIRELYDGGQDVYIRMPASKHAKRSLVIVTISVPVGFMCGLLIIVYYLLRRKSKAKGKDNEDAQNEMAQKEKLDLPFLSLATISRATDNFSGNKKIGEGGFGPVYKGLLMDGLEIAVKRLSNSSGQGIIEFINEVKLIAKLQHRNLVRLLDCCIQGGEQILIYEYMPNGSLDAFLFDLRRRSLLDWPKRFNIICGIARGLLYLHQDSRLRIIHRDLKASNVLLDNELSPKISDFGLARTFGGDQVENRTKRIVGTFGYMAPEYAAYGSFSVKSDVFSFGVLLLEIVSGRKNLSVDYLQSHHNLIGYAWKLWTDGTPLEIIDPSIHSLPNQHEMLRCVHVALLCIEQNPEDRPSMSMVALMLNGESILPQPKQPGFLIDSIPSKNRSLSKRKVSSSSVNDITITVMEAR